ncbi:MAG: carbamoyltransferase HypF [Fibrobacteria bacterium]|nr:carbamoyltransferase HypF [Fibrobacteria bacterium]
MKALEILLEGRVQGVGFRPFVWNLARSLGVQGWVANTPQGVTVFAQAPEPVLRSFAAALHGDLPPAARIQDHRERSVRVESLEGFSILESSSEGPRLGTFLPDLCLCDACRAELFDPANRRHLHPFISCTHCGPRFSITRKLPYDRPATTMGAFPLCPQCRIEYEDPADRRFHAQPICCPACGPRMWCEFPGHPLEPEGRIPEESWLETWAATLRQGGIALVRGIGGFHLTCDASNPSAVRTLRRRKLRDTKPFAIMVPDLAWARRWFRLSELEQQQLTSLERPIVLLEPVAPLEGGDWIAPGLSRIGVMLPHSPVHELLFSRFPAPVVTTSANRHHEPMITSLAQGRLHGPDWCDLLVLHDRDIANRCDDGVVAVAAGIPAPLSLRIGRGGSPREFAWPAAGCGLAVGADLKNTAALSHHGRVTLSQHIGDMEHPDTQDVALETWDRLRSSYRCQPTFVACDAHPDFASSRLARSWAEQAGIPLVRVQHHHAHIAATWLEHQWHGDALGIAMDGTGYGDPECVWGSEALHFTLGGSTTLAHFEGLRMPGGDAAVRDPSRLLIGALHDVGDRALLDRWMDSHPTHRNLYASGLEAMLVADLNCPRSRGMGRLFDLVGALLEWPSPGWDGEIGTRLEDLDHHADAPAWPVESDGPRILLAPILVAAARESLDGHPPSWISSRLHATVTEIISAVGRHAESRLGIGPGGDLPWAFGGGVFQNRRIVSRMLQHPLVQRRRTFLSGIPNDNGIALGQIVTATILLGESTQCA